MNIAYVKVSTNKQDVDNQKLEIENFCEKNNITINQWFEEAVSGTKDHEKRKLGSLLKQAQKNNIYYLCRIFQTWKVSIYGNGYSKSLHV